MLKNRLIPKLQLKRSQRTGKLVLVTTKRFDEIIEIGDPVSQAQIYQAQAADELMFINIAGNSESMDQVISIVRKTAEQVFMPFTVGGGVSSLEHFRLLLKNGADKVSINSAAVAKPELIREASEFFGAQCVVVSIDCKRKQDGRYSVWTQCGKKDTALDPEKWAVECERLGAGEILLSSIDQDGTGLGLDCDLIARVSKSISIPLIVSGGCGVAAHFVDGFKSGASAVAAGTFFCFRDQNPIQARSQIKNAGIPIRIAT